MPPLKRQKITNSPEVENTKDHTELNDSVQDFRDEFAKQYTQYQRLYARAEEQLTDLNPMDVTVEGLWNTLGECEENIRCLERLKETGLFNQMDKLITNLSNRIIELKEIALKYIEPLALRQICSAMQDKFIRQIAGSHAKVLYLDMGVLAFKDLTDDELARRAPNEWYYRYFQRRVHAHKNYLDMTEDMANLKQMYKSCTKGGTLMAHLDFPFNEQELVRLAELQMPMYLNYFKTFLQYNKTLSALRHEGMMKVDSKRFNELPIEATQTNLVRNRRAQSS